MDFSDNDLLQSTLMCDDDEKKEPVALVHDLLEEGWFFGKLLETKPRMSRSYSDLGNAILPDSTTPILPKKGGSSLVRAPSLPPYIGNQDRGKEGKNGKAHRLTRQSSDLTVLQISAEPCSNEKKERSKRVSGQSLRSRLVRTPSLPPCIGREYEKDDEDNEITMSRLIRQAMTNSSDLLPPKRAVPPKGSINSLSMPKHKPSSPPPPPPPRIPDSAISTTLPQKETQHQSPKQRYLKKSFSNLDMGSKYGKHDLCPTILSEGRVRRPHRSETCAPPIPNWAGTKSTEDMKSQLKFWARTVASNVR